jgi:Ca2+-binding RTX toxin-like protein
MLQIKVYREMPEGLVLPGVEAQPEDRYFLRPPVASVVPFDGVVADEVSSGVFLALPFWGARVLDPSLITEGQLRETTVSYGGGAYFFRYYYIVVVESGGPVQKVLGASLLDAQGAQVMDIGPGFGFSHASGDYILSRNLTTNEIFDRTGKPWGIRGEVDFWTILLGSNVEIEGGIAADVINATGARAARLLGGDGNDTLTGSAGDDSMYGGAGIDRLDGGAGRDSVNLSPSALAVNVTLAGANFTTVFINGVAEDQIRNFENVDGAEGNDTLAGDIQANELCGDEGNDTLLGLGGDDVLEGDSGIDVLDGGTGFDLADFYMTFETVRVTLAGATQATVLLAGLPDDKVSNIEGVVGSSANDTLFGDLSANLLVGSYGDDRLDGGGGNDTLRGGSGIDVLTGGVGNDTASWGLSSFGSYGATEASYEALRVTLKGAATVNVTKSGGLGGTLAGIENLIGGYGNDTFTGDTLANRLEGGDGDDTLRGGAGADVLIGGTGADFLDGGAGLDTADYSARSFLGAGAGIWVILGGSTETTLWANDYAELDGLVNIENVTGSGASDFLMGDSTVNRLSGRGGNDFLVGGGGVDVLDGGTGIDLASFGDKTLAVVVALNGAVTTTATVGNLAEDSLINIENLDGGTGNDTFTGDARANALSGFDGADTLSGGDGADLLKGGAGVDVLDGGAGLDRADYRDAIDAVVVALNGANTVQSTVGGAAADSLRNIETILAGSGADTLTGDNARNQLDGGSGSDTLSGKLGVDVLNGGADTATDWFIFDTALGTNNTDTVRQFTLGTDKLVLDDDVFSRFTGTAGGSTLSAANLVVRNDAVALDANDYLLFDDRSGLLSYDADGSGAGLAVPVAYVYYAISVEPFTFEPSASDFLIIA